MLQEVISRESCVRHILFKSGMPEDYTVFKWCGDEGHLYTNRGDNTSVIVPVLVYIINLSKRGVSFEGIASHLYLGVSVHILLALCDKIPDIWRSIGRWYCMPDHSEKWYGPRGT